MKKRLLSLALSFVMLLTMLPVSVWAEEDEVVKTSASCEIAVTPSQAGPEDGEDLFMGYLRHLGDDVTVVAPEWNGMGESVSFPAMMSIAASDHLDGVNLLAYQQLKEQIIAVAKQGGATEFTIPVEGVAFEEITYTLDDINEGYEEKCTLFMAPDNATDEVKKEAIEARSRAAGLYTRDVGFNVNAILSALSSDLPYELYWYDKTSATRSAPQVSMFTMGDDQELHCVGITSIYFYLPAAMAFGQRFTQDGLTYVRPNVVDEQIASGAQSVYTEAMKVVSAHSGESTAQRLRSYLDWVCQKTSYNSAAATDKSTPYGNPWQILWVFDDDPGTTVVCEGYAKAFKYLCDLTEWSDDVSCILATGEMGGGTGAGPHMWDVVQINGDNYLVDPTNCDENTVGRPDKLFLREWESGSYDGTYSFTVPEINYTYDADIRDTFSPGELMLKGDPAIPAAQPELVWQWGFFSEEGFETEGEIHSEMDASVFDEFTGRLAYVDADGTRTALSPDKVIISDGEKLQVTVDEENGGILRLKALAEGDVTLTYGIVTFVLHIHLPPVGFYAEQTAETPLDILDFKGTNDTVYLAVKDDAVAITAVEPGDGVDAVKKIDDDDGVYSVTIGTLNTASITVLVSGTMGDITAEQVPISLPVNDLRPGLVWHWLDRREDGWQENGSARYWDEVQGNTAVGYFAYSRYPLPERRLTLEELQQLTFDGVQYGTTIDMGEVRYVKLGFDEIGVATIYSNSEPGSPLKIRVNEPEVFLAADSAGEKPMLHLWTLDGNNDTAYICWPEDFVVTTITREDGNSTVTEITMDGSGRYAAVTLQKMSEDWLEFSIHGARKDHPENKQTYRVSIRLEDYRPGLRFFWVDGDWYEGTVDNIGNVPQRRLELAPGEVAYIQLEYFDGQASHSVDDGYTLPDVLEKAERKQETHLALRAVDFGSDDAITYTVDGETYRLPVSVTLPKAGFYKSTAATEENFLQSWSYTGENDIFYLLWPKNATLQSLTFDENSRTAIRVLNKSNMTADGYAQIEVLSYVDDWIGADVCFRYEGQDHDDNYHANLHLENNAPGLSFYWVDGDWNRDDTFTIREDQDPQSQLNMAVDGNAFIQLNFQDGKGNRQPVTDLDNVTVSGAVSLEKTVQGQYLVLRPKNFGSGTITYTLNDKTYTLPVVVELPELGFYDTFDDLPQEGSEGWEAQWQAHYVTRWNFQDKDSVVYLVPLHGGSIQSVEPHDGNEMDWRCTVSDDGAYAAFRLNSFSGGGDLGARVTFIRDGAQDSDTWDRWLSVADARENPLSATADMKCVYDKDSDIYWVRDLPLGDSVTLQAKVDGDSEGCTYQWYENGFDPERGVHYSEPIEDATGLSLTVENLQRNRGFTLRVTRKVDDNYSEICNVTFELCIKNDLYFAVTTEAATTYYGGTVDVAATMTAGEGAVTDGLFYEWYLEDTFFRGPDSAMTLDGVTRGGTYRLQVWDCYGNLFNADGKVEITVLPAQPGRVYLAHTNRDYGDGDVLEIYQGDTIHLGVTNAGYTNEATLPLGDLWLCTWNPTELEKQGFRFYGAEGEPGEEFTGKDDFESPYGPYVDTRNVQPGDYQLTFGYQLMSQLNELEDAKSYDPFTITIRVKAPEAKTVWNGEEFANGGTIYVQPGQTIMPVAAYELDLINDFAVATWDTEAMRQAGFTVGDEPRWVQYQGKNTAVPNISVPENLAPGTKATLTWRIVRGSTSPVANGENKWEDAETVYTYTVTIAIPERGNVNGAVNPQGKAVDVSDMQCLFEYLSLGRINSGLVKDENDSAQVAYFRTVADVNEDGLVNILDYQALYEIVKAQ